MVAQYAGDNNTEVLHSGERSSVEAFFAELLNKERTNHQRSAHFVVRNVTPTGYEIWVERQTPKGPSSNLEYAVSVTQRPPRE